MSKICQALERKNLNKSSDFMKFQPNIYNFIQCSSPGWITKDMFNKKLKEYKEKQAELETEMVRYTDADENFYLTANMVLNLAKRAYEIFESFEIPEKRQLLNFLLQNLKLQDKKLLFELKTPFDMVLLSNKCSNLLPSPKLIITLEDWNYMSMMKEKLLEIKSISPKYMLVREER